MADLVASMPLLELSDGSYVQFEAVDPTTGAAVAGVVAVDGVFTAIDVAGDGASTVDVFVPKVDPNYFAGETLT